MKVLVVVVYDPSPNPEVRRQAIDSEIITAPSEGAIRFGILAYLSGFVDIKSHSVTVLEPHLGKDPAVKT